MACAMCDVVEETPAGRVYAYRCSQCGACYACAHRATGDYGYWVCPDGVPHAVVYDVGQPVDPIDFRRRALALGLTVKTTGRSGV